MPVTVPMKWVSGCHREHLEHLQSVSSHTLSFRMQMYHLYLIPLNRPFLKMDRLLNALKNLQRETLWGCLQPSYRNMYFELLAKITHLSNNLHTCHILLVFKENDKAIKPTCLARVGERHFTVMKWNSQQMRLITQQLGGKEIIWSSFSHQLRITVHKNRHYWGEIQTP